MRLYLVKVSFPATSIHPSDVILDEIYGRSRKDALARAKWNWPKADKIEVGPRLYPDPQIRKSAKTDKEGE